MTERILLACGMPVLLAVLAFTLLQLAAVGGPALLARLWG